MNKIKKKVSELVKLEIVDMRNDVQQFKEWDSIKKMQFINHISTGKTDGITIAYKDGVVYDGRQVLLTLKQYMNDEISKASVSTFIPYGQLPMGVKERFDNLEFDFVEIPDVSESEIKDMWNRLTGEK